MINRSFLIVSLLIATMGGCIYRFNGVTIVLLVLVVVISCFNLNKWFVMIAISLGTSFLLYFIHDAHELRMQSLQPDQESVQISGVILPDEITIDGDNLITNARLDGNKHIVRLYAKLTSESEKQAWLSQKNIVHFDATCDLSRIKSPTNFNQFDAQKYYETKHITHQVTIKSWQVKPINSKKIWQKCRYQLHIWHARGIQNAAKLPQPLSDYTQALILGTTPQSLYGNNPGVQTLGLIHLFSVSGFHVSYVLMLLMAVLRRLYVPQEVSAWLGALLLVNYFVFAGEPTVLVRALIAGLIMMTRLAGCQRMPAESVWAVSLLGSLIYEPGILLTLGGQLSFAMTFCLLFTTKLNFWQVNLLLSAVSLPLIVSQQYTWHVLQTFVNFAAIPIFSVVIVPAVMVGFIGQTVPFVTHLMNSIIGLFAHSVDFIATLPGNLIIGKLSWFVSIILFLVALLLFVTEKKIAQWARVAWIMLLGIVLLWTRFPVHGEFSIFDIGQGDATLICEPFKRSVTLIDTGGQVTFGSKQKWQEQAFQRTKGETVIVNYLHSQGISHIDNLVLTHQDFDHIGDAKIMLQKIRVNHVIIPAGMAAQQAFAKEIKPYLKKTHVIEVTQGMMIPKMPLHIVHPFQVGKAENEDSIALYGNIGGQNIFTAGDLNQAGESAIAAKYPNMRVDILKLGHHGSKTSSNPAVIKQWQPKVGIVSAGRNNRYHHPHMETLKTIQDQQMTLFNTQTHGMIRYNYTRKKGQFEVKLNHELATTTTTN
ncbi:DNA internalization-related competence protein ComEC/Rec2 [Leuconostoc gelidum subsp. gasicomitatum]|uniref:DNA internalization-related competence protein ComEC/Rec2 n=1 Tax=Leuconostoc gasicomitatum TaxID=115778 RepID=UPI001CC46DD7|nr:DNA internalization-related competence protein ComEC/Rec2 [Leuconostoc gasicomitatum]MBZ5952601.1 DNA internalization-related competence protein ComEC/Rec2 [Leuconostoc gasicomitatum]